MLNSFSSQETCPITEASGTNPSLTSHTKLTVTFCAWYSPQRNLRLAGNLSRCFRLYLTIDISTVRCRNLVPCCLHVVTCGVVKTEHQQHMSHTVSTAWNKRQICVRVEERHNKRWRGSWLKTFRIPYWRRRRKCVLQCFFRERTREFQTPEIIRHVYL